MLTVPLLLVKAPNPSLGSFRAPRLQEAPFAHSCIHSLNLLAGTCLLSTYCAPGNTTVKAGWWGRHTCAACWDAHRVRQVREPQGKKEIREGFLEAEKA